MRFLILIGIPMLLLGQALSLEAQDRASIETQISLGKRDAIIEGTCSSGGGQVMLGGSFRYYATQKTSIGPELLYMRPCERQVFTFYHPQVSGMLQIVHDFGRNAHIRPYLIAGAGIVRHRSLYGPQTKGEIAGGAGVKIFASKRTFIAPELQVGAAAPSVRFKVGFGIVFR